MPWPKISLRDRRQQVRDDIAAHLPGADASIPNAPLSVLAEAQASLTHDNDQHLDDWVVRMMMPDTAEGEFADRWANIWLPEGRKGATFAAGFLTVAGVPGAAVPTGAQLTYPAYDANGTAVTLLFSVTAGGTLSGPSGTVPVSALTEGALANVATGAQLSFVDIPTGIDGVALVADPGLAGGAEQEADADLISRYITRIQQPPHGGAGFDYEAWALEVAGVTRAWASQDMGVGTVSVRFLMDEVRASSDGIPLSGDLAVVQAYVAARRPVTVAQVYVVAPVAQPVNITIADLANDTPEVRANIVLELREMLRARAKPGAMIYAAWIGEAISAASGEDHHSLSQTNVVPSSSGHIVVLGTVTFT